MLPNAADVLRVLNNAPVERCAKTASVPATYVATYDQDAPIMSWCMAVGDEVDIDDFADACRLDTIPTDAPIELFSLYSTETYSGVECWVAVPTDDTVAFLLVSSEFDDELDLVADDTETASFCEWLTAEEHTSIWACSSRELLRYRTYHRNYDGTDPR